MSSIMMRPNACSWRPVFYAVAKLFLFTPHCCALHSDTIWRLTIKRALRGCNSLSVCRDGRIL